MRIGGLQGQSELNGQCGMATAYDAVRDRVAVALGDGGRVMVRATKHPLCGEKHPHSLE